MREFERAVAACPQIVSCYSTTGQADYVIRCWLPDIRATSASCTRRRFKLPGVTHVRSSVVLKEVKAEAGVPIADPAEPGAPAASRSRPSARAPGRRRAG